MNTSILLCLSIGLAVVHGRVAPPSKSTENKDKRGALSGSYGAPSSLSYGGSSAGAYSGSSAGSYESSSSYGAPSHSYGAPSSYSPSESSSSYSDSSYSSPSYSSSSDYSSSSSDSGFKPIKSAPIEHSSYSQPPVIPAPYSHGLSVGVLPSPGLDYSSLSYGSFGGLSSLGAHAYGGGFGGAYPYSPIGLGATSHYARLGPVPFGAIGAPYGGIPVHAGIQDYSSLAAAPIAPISLPAYSSASLYSSPISSFHSLPSSYAPSQYGSPSYSSNAFSGSSLSSYSNNKPYSSSYGTSSDYSSPSKYSSALSGSSAYSSGYSSSGYSSPTSSSYTAPPYSRYPSANRDSYSGSSSSYKSGQAKEYNF